MFLLLQRLDGLLSVTELDDQGAVVEEAEFFELEDLADLVDSREAERPRWVWTDTRRWYPELLAAGVRVERCVDLRLGHAVLKLSQYTASTELATAPLSAWDRPVSVDAHAPVPRAPVQLGTPLFDIDAPAAGGGRGSDAEQALEDDALAEFGRQLRAVAGATQPGALRLLLAAESAGALIALEMPFAGVPWDVAEHERILESALGPKPEPGERPAELERILVDIRAALDDPAANPDSPVELLKSLNNAGIPVKSTGKWELLEVKHPVVSPLMEYKRRARLLTANGWNWLEQWVVDGRFRTEYIVAGVVTGRWASNGGGALQLPKEIRSAVVADLGWQLVVADAAQLEPRILAGMAGDEGMMRAGNAGDLYNGIVAAGAVQTREQAKVAMLGAMYGATTGESGRLMPQLTRAFPRAIGLTETAARAGERGEQVTTRLGRSSPLPGEDARAIQEAAYGEGAGEKEQSRARSHSRAWGRFTRNFVVQGTAAEWALCWMASLRRRLAALSAAAVEEGLIESGPWNETSPHLVFFVHDEVMVHCPASLVDRVSAEITAAAEEAGRLLFGEAPVRFPISVDVARDYASAK